MSFLPFDLLPFTIKTSVIYFSRGMLVQIKSQPRSRVFPREERSWERGKAEFKMAI